MSLFGFILLSNMAAGATVQRTIKMPAGTLPSENLYKLSEEIYFHFDNERFSEAIEAFETRLTINPGAIKPHEKQACGKLMQVVGDCYRTQDNWAAAIQCYEGAFERIGYSPVYHDLILASIAICNLKLGRKAEANVQLQKIDPGYRRYTG
jgi:tetratricopeptide (TPR) repeat protein